VPVLGFEVVVGTAVVAAVARPEDRVFGVPVRALAPRVAVMSRDHGLIVGVVDGRILVHERGDYRRKD
jgi:hypothetical protein